MRADVVARAMRLIRDGIVDREGVEGLARRLGYSVRQLNRVVTAEVGTGPLAIARAQRAQTARILLETTTLPIAHVAFAAGFSSVRQCNETLQQIFADTPRGLRRPRLQSDCARRTERREPRRSAGDPAAAALSTPVQPRVGAGLPRRTRRPRESKRSKVPPTAAACACPTVMPSSPSRRPTCGDDGPAFVEAELHLSDLRDLTTAVARCRQLLDLDADPVAIVEALEAGPVRRPAGVRTPGPAGTGGSRRVRARRTRHHRPAGLRGGGAHDRRAVGQRRGRGAPRAHRRDHPPLPHPRGADRPGREDPAAFSMPGGRRRRPGRAGRSGGHGRCRDRPRHRPCRVAGLARRACPASDRGRPSTSPCGRSAIPTPSCRPTSASGGRRRCSGCPTIRPS